MSRLVDSFGIIKNKGREKLFWVLLAAAMLLRYGYYGFRYFPVVDDNNMYGIFSRLSPWQVLERYRMYTTRPAAALLDAYVISRLWNCMWLVLLLVVLLHFASCFFIYKVSEKNSLKTGIVLSIIFALFPLGNDATYWIAASSRTVFGMFFMLLSLFLLMNFIERRQAGGKNTVIILLCFELTNLLSLGFYEQIIVLSLAVTAAILLYNYKRLKDKWILLFPVINAGIIFAFYIYFSGSGNMAARGQLVKVGLADHTIRVLKRIRELLTVVPARMVKHGIINGFQLILSDGTFLFLVLALLIGAGIGLLYAKEDIRLSAKAAVIKLVIGLALVYIPFAPFFALDVIWIALRNTFTSFIGIGLIIEAIISLVLGRANLKVFRGIAAGLAVTLFIVINAAEVSDYRSVSNIDREIVANIGNALRSSKDIDLNNRKILLLNAKPLYITPVSPHFANCTASDWAFTGAFSVISRDNFQVSFVPLGNGTTAAFDTAKLDKALFVGLDDKRNAFLLDWEQITDQELELKQDGKVYGEIAVLSGNQVKFILK